MCCGSNEETRGRLPGCQCWDGPWRPLIQVRRPRTARLHRSRVSKAPVMYHTTWLISKGKSNLCPSLPPKRIKVKKAVFTVSLQRRAAPQTDPCSAWEILFLDFNTCPLKLKLVKRQNRQGALGGGTGPITLAPRFNAS